MTATNSDTTVYVPCVVYGEDDLSPQGAFLSEAEAQKVLDFWASQGWSSERLEMDRYPLFGTFQDWVEEMWEETNGTGRSPRWTGSLPPARGAGQKGSTE